MTEHKKALIPAPSHALTVIEPPHDANEDVPRPPSRRLALYVGLAAVALLAVGAYGHWRTSSAATETQKQQQDFVPEVRTARAERDDKPVELALPGQTEAFDSANIFARATGYVTERRADIGTRVHKGDLLMRIAAPDLDQQLVQAQAQMGQFEAALLQAHANFDQAKANTKLADVTKFRTTTLAGQGWETKQNADNATANAAVQVAAVASAQAGIAVAEANLRAQQATIQRLHELTGFEQVIAPFDGVVTARSVDAGNLVSADANGGTPLFSVARDDVLRVAVYVPQSGAVGIRDGLDAELGVPELPGRVFHGRVSRSARALDATSRSMLTEVDVDNRDGALRAGLFANIRFAIPRERPGIVVPDEALVFNADGLQVASVDQGGVVTFHKVSIYRDFGTSAELRDGLQGGEQIVLSPPADLLTGSRVKIAKSQPDQKTAKR